MAAFSQQNLTDIREVFDLYDKTGKGSIDHLSVAEVIRCLGYNPTQTDLGKALQNTKLENMTKQFISFDQFCPILSELMKNEANVMDEEFIEGLRVFDRDSSGLISAAELNCVDEQSISGLKLTFYSNFIYADFFRLLQRIFHDTHSDL